MSLPDFIVDDFSGKIDATTAFTRLFTNFFLSFMTFAFFQKYMEKTTSVGKELIILSLCICVVLMSIGNSVPHSFGLFAALTLIRFRTPIKNQESMVSLFLFVVIGISTGLGHQSLAILSTAFILLAYFILNSLNASKRFSYSVHIIAESEQFREAEPQIHEIFKERNFKAEIVELSDFGEKESQIFYNLKTHRRFQFGALNSQIRTVRGIKQCHIKEYQYYD